MRKVRDAVQNLMQQSQELGAGSPPNRKHQLHRSLKTSLHIMIVGSMRRGFSLARAAARRVKGLRMLGSPERRNAGDDAGSAVSRSLPVVPRDRRLAVLNMVQGKLRDHGVRYRSHITDAHAYCAVRDSELDEVRKALNDLGRDCGSEQVHVWFGRGLDYDDPRFAESLTATDIAQIDSMVVGLPRQIKRFRVARSGGAEILIVERRGLRFVARRLGAAKVDWTSDFDEVADPCESPETRKRSSTRKRHALEGEPIDCVYTWVDSTDAGWQTAMHDWAERGDASLDSSNNNERYLDRGELRYSLRSLWLYAPYVRRIYLVTAGHYPRWLNLRHDKIQVVPHETIFPDADSLPTFNSHAIEACLHRIPGLAEHFVYFNDDVLLGRETTVETFFTKAGLIKSRFSPTASVPVARPDISATPTDWASYNAAAITGDDFGIQFDRKLKHVPMAMKRSLLYEIEERYHDMVARTRRARFRSRSDVGIPTMLAHFYGISTGKAVECEHIPGEYMYADTGRNDFETQLAWIVAGHPMFICLNATRYCDIPLPRQALLLDEFFEETYPVPSPFEVDDEEPPSRE